MKKFSILFVILFVLLINTGCKNSTDRIDNNAQINDDAKIIEIIKNEKKLSKDDFDKFITDYFAIYCTLRGRQFRFWDDYYNDERMQKIKSNNNSDISVMNFLGKQGLNDLEISEVSTNINALSKNKISEDFPNSVKNLNNAKKYLERFFQGSKNLINFNEFQTNVSVDLLSYRDIMEELQYSLTNECDMVEYRNPEFFEGDEIKNFCNAEKMCNFIRGYTLKQEHFKEE
jgi:hypothetical protein